MMSFGFSRTDQGVPDFNGERDIDDTEGVNMANFACAQPKTRHAEPMIAYRDAWPCRDLFHKDRHPLCAGGCARHKNDAIPK